MNPLSRQQSYGQAPFAVSRLVACGAILLSFAAAFGEIPPRKEGAVLKKTESGEAGVWEEPSMFPREPELPERPLPAIRQNPMDGNEPPGLDPFSTLAGEPDVRHNPAAFQTDFRNLGQTGIPATGLESTRERDAMLYRSQGNVFNQPYNIKIGPVPFRLSGGIDVDFTDNATRSNFNTFSELTLLPRLDISGSLRLTSFASLSLSLGIGYIKYFNQSENDRLLPLATAALNPEAGISFNIKIGKFLVNVFDRPQTPQFQADAVTQRNLTQYQQFSNVAGVSVIWDVNSRTGMSFRYAHSNLISLASQAGTTDGSTDDFLASLSCKLSDSLGIGLEAGTTVSKYEESFLNNGTTYHAGPFVTLRASDFLRFEASAGYQGGSYDSGGAIGDNSDLGSYYVNFSVSNNLNPYFNHSLSFGHESRRGAYSNSTEVDYVRYRASWDVIRIASLGFNASFEDVQESGGLFAQHLSNFTVGLQSALQLTKHISISLVYQFTKRVGDGDEESSAENSVAFNENRFSLRLTYLF